MENIKLLLERATMLQGNNMLNKYKFRMFNIQRLKEEIYMYSNM